MRLLNHRNTAGAPTAAWRTAVELLPFLAFAVLVCAKLVYSSILIDSEWWASDETIRQWIRPTFYFWLSLWQRPQVLLGTVAVVLLVLSPFLLLPRRGRYVVLLLLDAILTSVGVATVVHVRFSGDVMTLSDILLAPQAVKVTGAVARMLHRSDLLSFVDCVMALFLTPFYFSVCNRVEPLGTPKLRRVAGVAILFATIAGLPSLWTAIRLSEDLLDPSLPRVEAATSFGILPFTMIDGIASALRPKPLPSQEQLGEIRRYIDHLQGEQPRSALFAAARGRNFILINGESLQAFPIGLTMGDQPVAPHIAAFAKESIDFLNFFDQTYLGTTSDAEFMAVQSLHPLAAGVVSMRYRWNTYRSLPSILVQHGYATISACAAAPEFWSMDQMHRNYGFEQSYFESAYVTEERIGPWLADERFLEQSTEILKKQRRPFMALLLTASSHLPYEIPRKYRRLSLGNLEATLLGDYLQSVHYFDEAFGTFIEQLRRAGLLDTSVVALYGDHQGFLGDPPALATLLGMNEWSEFERVMTRKRLPFMIRLPHGEHSGIYTNAGGHLDIAPTLLSLLGIEEPGRVMLGGDLTTGRSRTVVFRDGSFTDGRMLFMNARGATSGCRCYDVSSGRRLDCRAFAPDRDQALAKLRISDTILRANLIPSLRMLDARNVAGDEASLRVTTAGKTGIARGVDH